MSSLSSVGRHKPVRKVGDSDANQSMKQRSRFGKAGLRLGAKCGDHIDKNVNHQHHAHVQVCW